jgi:hypothetical protein
MTPSDPDPGEARRKVLGPGRWPVLSDGVADYDPAMKLMNDPAVRQRAARDVHFEVKSLWTTAIEYASRPRDVLGRDVTIDNALIESCLVHARLLADFLDLKKASREDVLAVHYLPSWESTDTLTKSERDRINWMIMHLSAERSRVGNGIDLVETAERVLQVIGRFVGEITDPNVQRWFAPVVRERAAFARRRQELEAEGKDVRIVSTTNESVISVIDGVG